VETIESRIPQELAKVIRDGLKHGVSEEQIIKGMVTLGNFAEKIAHPDNPEEAFIKAVWNEANASEKETLAAIILRIGKKRRQQAH